MMLRDPPGDALLARIESPRFVAPPPQIVHPDRIPPVIWDACVAHRQGVFAARPISIWLLRDVLVAAEGLVFDQDGALFRPSVTQHGEAEIGWAESRVRAALSSPETPRFDRPLVLGKKRGAANYGHWLMEMLPMLHLVTRRFPDPTIGVLLHDVTDPQLGEVIRIGLNRLGIADRRVRVCGPEPVRVDRLLLVEGMTDHGVYMSPLVRDCHRQLAEGIPGNGAERVFIARGTGLRRDFADSTAREQQARDAGYTVMHPQGIGLLAQIAMLRDARVVAGAMGAAMTSLAFMRMPGQALIFAGADMPDTFFWFVSTLFGHRYREIRCRQGEADPTNGVFYDRPLLIEPEEFRRHLMA